MSAIGSSGCASLSSDKWMRGAVVGRDFNRQSALRAFAPPSVDAPAKRDNRTPVHVRCALSMIVVTSLPPFGEGKPTLSNRFTTRATILSRAGYNALFLRRLILPARVMLVAHAVTDTRQK